MTEKLRALYEEWLALHDHMKATLNPEKVASLFLPPLPEYVPRAPDSILYVGKATAGGWYETAGGSVNERQACTRNFIELVRMGGYHSDCWSFAKRLSVQHREEGMPLFGNLVWSNLCKIGVAKGNPAGAYLGTQFDLATETLREEITAYRPTLVVFTSSTYAPNIIYRATGYSASGWITRPSGSWVRPASSEMPAMLWIDHPQGKRREKPDGWVEDSRSLLTKNR
jgi:hypothetical protein